MLQTFKNGQGSIVLRVKLLDSSKTDGSGLTGLTSASTGLIISTIADNEASATTYTVAGSTIEAVTTLGTYAAPTATKCRFKEVDATNHPGIYELQIADARFAVSGAKSILVSLSGATNLSQTDFVVQLQSDDPYVAKPTNYASLSIDGSGHVTFANTSIATVTDLTNLPSIPANWLTAAGIAASALNGKGDWNVGKTGYSLTQAFPSNFSSLAISVGGAVTVGTNSDKTGYSLTQTFPTNFADMAITATTGQVTVGTNNDKTGYTVSTVSDKTGYSLTSAYDAAKTAAQVSDIPSASTIATAVWGVLTSALTTASTVGKLIVDYLDAAVSTRSTYAGADTAGTTTLLTRIPSAITITGGLVDVNDKTGFALTTAYDPAKTAAQAGDAMTLTTAYDFAKGTVAMTEDYAVNGAAPTPAQALMAIHQDKFSFSISGTSKTVKKLDNSTSAYVVTLNSATTPTGATRS